MISLCTCITFAEGEVIIGDVEGDGVVDNNDAIYLLYNTIFGDEDYPVNQPCDFTGDGLLDNEDAIYLLYHTIFGEDEYPLEGKEPDGDDDVEPAQPLIYPVPINSANWDRDSFLDESIVKYNPDGSAFIETGSIVGWSIPQVALGKTVNVTVKGSSVGGFRVWLLAPGQATASNQVHASNLGFAGGEFNLTFTLTAEDFDNRGISYADAICFKAASWNTQLDQLLIESVEVTYPPEIVDNRNWVAVWGSAQLQAGTDHLPKNISLSGNTVRQQIRMTKAGRTARFVFSNESGNGPLTINAATVAQLISPTSSQIDASTLANITFNGGSISVTIPAGQTITSDEIKYSFEALDDLAVSLYLGSAPSNVTSHTASRCSTWVGKGDLTQSSTVSGDTTTSWYFLSRVDTILANNAGAIVCLGDSLTDGASVTTNGFSRWPDELARQLNADADLNNYSVINMGIGATPLMGWGSAGEARFSRDVLNVPGVKALVILYGVNDIGYAGNDISQNIINTYKNMIAQCHARGIKVYGCTITPFYNPTGAQQGYYSELHEQIRLKVNEFILSPDSGFDGYIDTASAVANPSDTKQMQKQYVSVWGDWLHFNDTGYKFVGKTVYDKLKTMLD